VGKKILIISIAAAVLVFGGGGLFTAYAMFDVFKSPKTVYLESEYKAWRAFEAELSEAIRKWKTEYELFLKEPYESETEISDLNVEGLENDEVAGEMLDFLRDWTLSVRTKTDPGNERYLSETVLSLDGERFVGIDTAVEETRIGFRVADILDKYLVINLQSDANDELPNRIVSVQDMVDALRISGEDVKPILAKYVDIYVKELKDSQVTLSKNVPFKRGDFEKNVREVTVTFSTDELVNLMVKWLEQMEQDEALIDLLYDKYESLAKLAEDSGESVDVMSKGEFTGKFKDGIRETIDELGDGDKYDDALRIVLLVDGKDRMLSRAVTLKGTDDAVLEVERAKWTDSGNTEQVELVVHLEEDEGDFDFEAGYTWQAETGEGTFRIEGSGESFGDKSAVAIGGAFTITDKEGREAAVIEFDLKVKEAWDNELREVLRASIRTEGERDEAGRSGDHTSQVSLAVTDENDRQLTVSFKMRTKTAVGGSFPFPSYNDDNSIDLLKMAKENPEFDPQFVQELIDSLTRFMEEERDILDRIGEVFGISIPGPDQLLGLSGGPWADDPFAGWEDVPYGNWTDGSFDAWLDGSFDVWMDGSYDAWLDGSYDVWMDGSYDAWLEDSYGAWVDGLYDDWIESSSGTVGSNNDRTKGSHENRKDGSNGNGLQDPEDAVMDWLNSSFSEKEWKSMYEQWVGDYAKSLFGDYIDEDTMEFSEEALRQMYFQYTEVPMDW